MPLPPADSPLRPLADPRPPDSGWAWAVGHPEVAGRLRLPAPARELIGHRHGMSLHVGGVCHQVGLVLRPAERAGAFLRVDGHGRLALPVWLRERGPVAIGTNPAGQVIVIAPNRGARPRRRPSRRGPSMSAGLSPRTATVAEFVDDAAGGFGASTARTYQPYWRLLTARHGDTWIGDIGLGDLELVVADAVARARRRRPETAARAPRESCVAALRALFTRAHAAGLTATNPAAALAKPRRGRSRRRALDLDELAQLVDAVRTTSRDPDLDLLLVRFHLETGARRQGALNLSVGDLDPARATVWLREKDDTEREQPVSPSLVRMLEEHSATRAGAGAVFRTSGGQPLSARRYDTLFGRARTALPWSDRVPVSAHVLRDTAITAVARMGGYPVAQAFAGHTPPTVTGRYIHATLAEIATVIAQLTGEPHPLATRHGPPGGRCERPRAWR